MENEGLNAHSASLAQSKQFASFQSSPSTGKPLFSTMTDSDDTFGTGINDVTTYDKKKRAISDVDFGTDDDIHESQNSIGT